VFKLACLVHQSLSGQAPAYLADDCCLVSDTTRCSLLSADVPTCIVPPTYSSYGDRIFAAAGPRLWNSIPVQMHSPDFTYGLVSRVAPKSGSGQNTAFFPNPQKSGSRQNFAGAGCYCRMLKMRTSNASSIFHSKISRVSHRSLFCLHSTDV